MRDMGTDVFAAEVTSETGDARPEDARPEKEIQTVMSFEVLSQMSLESLLYYVLVGDGRVKSEPVGGRASVAVLGGR